MLLINLLMFFCFYNQTLIESSCQAYFINIWPVKPFRTVMVIKGYANRISFNLCDDSAHFT